MPVQAAQVQAGPSRRAVADAAVAEYHQTAREIRQQQAARSAWAGYHDMAQDLPRLQVQTEQARTAAAYADTRVDQLATDPALTIRPDAGEILTRARTDWTTTHTAERAEAAARAAAARAQEAARNAPWPNHAHDVPTYNPGIDRSLGR